MSKHFSIFYTESQYQSGITSLDFPNVSLVEQTGNVHYSVAVGPKEIWAAAFGDILFYDVDGDTLITLPDEVYNTDDYPIAKFEPIGVCIYDKASYEGNKAVFMSLKNMDYSNPTIGSTGATTVKWGFSNTKGISPFLYLSYTDTKTGNEYMKTLQTNDWSGNTINNNNYTVDGPAWACCWRFSTNGTKSGDWYMPSYYDLMKYSNNYSTINNIMNSIKTKNPNSVGIFENNAIWTGCDRTGSSRAYGLMSTGNIDHNNSTTKSNDRLCKAVYLAGPEEL